MRRSFTGSTVEDAACAWLERIGWTVCPGAIVAPGEPVAEGDDHGRVGLAGRLHGAWLRKLISGELGVPTTEPLLRETA